VVSSARLGSAPACRAAGDGRPHQRDRLRDPVHRQPGTFVELADLALVGGGDEREHDLVDRHEDRAEVFDLASLRTHRRDRRFQPRQGATELVDVDVGPVPLDEEDLDRVAVR